MRFACWITKATDTQFIAFARQQWLREPTLPVLFVGEVMQVDAENNGTNSWCSIPPTPVILSCMSSAVSAVKC
jgi:hypothetical protein